MARCDLLVNLLTFKKKKKHDAGLCSMSLKDVSTSNHSNPFRNIHSHFVVVSGKKEP